MTEIHINVSQQLCCHTLPQSEAATAAFAVAASAVAAAVTAQIAYCQHQTRSERERDALLNRRCTIE